MKRIGWLLGLGLLWSAGVRVGVHGQSGLPTYTGVVQVKEDPEKLANWGMDCSIYCAVEPTVRASSSLTPGRRIRYDARRAHDFDLTTAWVEGKRGDGSGEYLEYTYDLSALPRSQLVLTSVTVFNGYRKSRSLWKENGRVKRFRVSVNGRPRAILNVKDSYNYQTVKLGNIPLPAHKKTVLRFQILDVYRGTRYADTAVTELEFDGTGHH